MKKLLLLLFLVSHLILNGQQKIGLVLSGGGASGMAHVGVLKAIEENNIPIDYITGTSVGAFIGGLYAAGYSPLEIEAIVTHPDFINASNGLIGHDMSYYFKQPEKNASLVSWKFNLDSTLEASIPTSFVSSNQVDYGLMNYFAGASALSNGNFDSLFVPFRCIASNISDQKEMVFNNGELPSAIRASMTYPFYISPIEVDGKIMFDGGLYNNFPADILCNEFQPDFIIASNVTAKAAPPTVDNLLSQIKFMLTKEPDFNLSCAKGIIINSEVDDISTFDFEKNSLAILRGYESTQNLMDSIKENVNAIRSQEDLNQKRQVFKSGLPPLIFDDVKFNGLHTNYVRLFKKKVFKNDEQFSEEKLRPHFYLLATDPKIKSLYPRAIYQKGKKSFNLELDTKIEKDFSVSFGGVVSSKPFSTGFIELDYQNLSATELNLNGNIYFGGFYSSAQASARWDIPFKVPFFIAAKFNVNRTDYFNSLATIIDDESTPYIINSEEYFETSIGFPIRKKGKISIGGNFAWQDFNYYQSDDFNRGDTADLTTFNSHSGFIRYEINSLNRKMYPTKGGRFEFLTRYILGKEKTIPGSISTDKATFKSDHDWALVRLNFEQYFLKNESLTIGLALNATYSDQPFFHNFTATTLNAAAYQPIPESRTIFQQEYRAFTFLGGGAKIIYPLREKIDLRAEFYVFQPYEELSQAFNRKAILGKEVTERDFIGSLTAVYHTPIGPLATSFNYYDDEEVELSFLIHFGYIIFNKGARE